MDKPQYGERTTPRLDPDVLYAPLTNEQIMADPELKAAALRNADLSARQKRKQARNSHVFWMVALTGLLAGPVIFIIRWGLGAL